MSSRSDFLSEAQLDFIENENVLALKSVHSQGGGAPYRFIYSRQRNPSAGLHAGHVYAWVAHIENKDPWGKWELLADMRFNSHEEIEAFMRNAARLGMDTGYFKL